MGGINCVYPYLKKTKLNTSSTFKRSNYCFIIFSLRFTYNVTADVQWSCYAWILWKRYVDSSVLYVEA